MAADLNPVALNTLLHKFETDFACLIKNYFKDSFSFNNTNTNNAFWLQKSKERQQVMHQFLWDKKDDSFYDYNYKTKKPHKYASTTNFYPLWANIATKDQAKSLVKKHLPKLICKGGLASTSNLENIYKKNIVPDKQWDFPYGWAPHQILIWQGLLNYNYKKEAQELIYRWLYMIVKTAVNYNGLIPEKFNIVDCTHKTDVEYGNVGVTFKYIPDGGFGWTNASFKVGLDLLDKKYIKKLNSLIDPDVLFVIR